MIAGAVWIFGPPTATPAAPPPPALPPPVRTAEPPFEPLDADDPDGLNAVANDPAEDLRRRRAAINLLFTHHIRPPADAARVRAALKDRQWLDGADIVQITFAPVDLPDRPRVFAVIPPFAKPMRPTPYLLIYVSGLPDPKAGDLAELLRGDGPTTLRIEDASYGN